MLLVNMQSSLHCKQSRNIILQLPVVYESTTSCLCMDLPVTIGEVENIISYTYIFEHVLHTHIHTHTHTLQTTQGPKGFIGPRGPPGQDGQDVSCY